MIGTIVLVIAILLIVVKLTFDSFQWLKQINYIADVIIPMKYGKKDKQPRWTPYSEMEDLEELIEEDTAFAMPIDMLEEEEE